MPEYDAFGREIGEDPLAALRDATAAAPKAEPVEVEAAAAPVEVAPEPVVARPQFVRPRRRRRRGMASLLVLGALIFALGLGGAFVTDRIAEFVDELPTAEGPEAAPSGLGRDSLLRRANLAAALEILRRSHPGRPVTLRVAPGRIDATLAGPDGIRQVQVGYDLSVRTLATADAAAIPPTIPYRRIDPAAPERLARSGNARRIDHVQLVPGRPVRWRAVFGDGTVVMGDASGRSR